MNNTKFTIHPGRKSKFESIEEELLNSIILITKQNYLLQYLVRHMDRIDPEQIKDNEHT